MKTASAKWTTPMLRLAALALGSTVAFGCGGGGRGSGSEQPAAASSVIRITGSDTMVNLIQAWAENYRKARPDISVQVAGGGSGVGIAGLINGILDIAASSREMEAEETARAAKESGTPPQGFTVGLDALAVYVHASNPIETISVDELAEIYGDGGTIDRWSKAGVSNTACGGDEIVRVGRQNNSGTYVYFRETILGHNREFALGSIDQSGSKDVVTLVSRTPCAIGYSGMAYSMPGVKALKVAKTKGAEGVAPTPATALDGSYVIARPLYLYTRSLPTGPVKEFLDWALGPEGQRVVQEIGYVPAPVRAQ